MMRVVVTGLGCLSPLGNNTNEFTKNLLGGICAIGPVENIEVLQARTKIAAEVKNFSPQKHFTKSQISQMDRFSLLALMATREAVTDANIDFSNGLAERTAIVYGTGIGGQQTQDDNYRQLYAEGAKRVHPFAIPRTMPSAATSQISMEFGITGPSLATTSACASAAHAIGMALLMLRSGMVDVAITGGSEAPITPGSILPWEGLRVLSKTTCSPFSGKRGGMVLGEGAGTLILETLDHAQQRGAKIYAELSGFGMCADACNLVKPSIEGMARAMSLALSDASLVPSDVAYINAHGTGTPQNDPVETSAIRKVFGDHADKLLVSSSKSMHGHLLGASPAIEAIATIAAIQEQCAPPTMGFIEPDPDCDLNYVFGKSQEQEIDSALSNSFAFGGLNAVLAFKRFLD